MAAEDAASPCNPAWKGWQRYHLFAESVKTTLRFVRNNATNEFLEKVLSSCGERKVTIPEKRIFWRARRGCEFKLLTEKHDDLDVSWDEERPYSQKEMKPISNWQCEGRANPRGIPYLYLATDRSTALAEVRP